MALVSRIFLWYILNNKLLYEAYLFITITIYFNVDYITLQVKAAKYCYSSSIVISNVYVDNE